MGGVCTFKEPFAPPAVPAGNGYFSVWVGFLASLLLLSETMSIGDAKSLKGRAAGLFFAAVMLLIATIKYVDPNDGVEFPSVGPQTQTTDDIAIFGMASAAATILITILIIFADMKESAIQTLIPILVWLLHGRANDWQRLWPAQLQHLPDPRARRGGGALGLLLPGRGHDSRGCGCR